MTLNCTVVDQNKIGQSVRTVSQFKDLECNGTYVSQITTLFDLTIDLQKVRLCFFYLSPCHYVQLNDCEFLKTVGKLFHLYLVF
jgi:hypothetical protein